MTLAENVLDQCRQLGLKISTAESCTGGKISAALTDIAGSSDVFDRGYVTYSNQAKMDMLDVRADTLDMFGAVSEQVAQEMAIGALSRSQADVAVSVTGIAGPGGSENKPEGRVCFGIASKSSPPSTQTRDFGAIGRSEVRKATTTVALQLIIAATLPEN